ncbi:Uncharacterised protein [Escherichia coli]|uniref:Outer membrane protein n=1 Tax=Escherichia phage fEgEco12 TaxID=3158837 RepID=A0AAU7PHY0_9CAUD|nr:hypothetical protein [Escherichia coli]MED6536645.1 hypothetical protein [Escherichia coli O157]QAY00286.1 hypothetical protein Ecwhy1_3 [Escherichia phage Ecwhy_1]WGM49748.1 hypothetical protein EcMJ_506 [Escherichia phage vB_Ec-M-J]ELW0836414.1 hypothetical protein [Escherichia coli]VVY15538.1 Uncharacterised protein [Escherichia coli]
MNSVIFLIIALSPQSGVQITPMNSMNQCIAVRDSTYEQVNSVSLRTVGEELMWCYNSNTKEKLIVGQTE